jgi:hypothetical protein
VTNSRPGPNHNNSVVPVNGGQLGAPLALTTPIPTPAGWSTMGDLVPGDFGSAEDGAPCRVTGVSPVLLDRECLAIEFEGDHRESIGH